MIRSFRCADTQVLFETGKCKRYAGISNVATRSWLNLQAAYDLRVAEIANAKRIEREITPATT